MVHPSEGLAKAIFKCPASGFGMEVFYFVLNLKIAYWREGYMHAIRIKTTAGTRY